MHNAAFVVGGANYVPEDFAELQTALGDDLELHCLPQESEGFSYEQHRGVALSGAREWHQRLLDQDKSVVGNTIETLHADAIGILSHCGGSHRALELVRSFQLDFAILINPASQKADKQKLNAVDKAPDDIRLRGNAVLKMMLSPLTPNVDPKRYRQFVTRHMDRLERDPYVLDGAFAEGIWMSEAEQIAETIDRVSCETGTAISVIDDPNDPWFMGDLKAQRENVERIPVKNGGHYLHIFNPQKTAESIQGSLALGKRVRN